MVQHGHERVMIKQIGNNNDTWNAETEQNRKANAIRMNRVAKDNLLEVESILAC